MWLFLRPHVGCRWDVAICALPILWLAVGAARAEDADSLAASAPRYEAKGKRDPFVPLVRDGRMIAVAGEVPSASAPVDLSLPLLGGILWDSAGRSIALLNEKEAMVGDVIGGYQVAEIHPDYVVLDQEGRRVTVRITFDQSGTSQMKPDRREGEP